MNNQIKKRELRFLLIAIILGGIFNALGADDNYRFDTYQCLNDNSTKLGHALVECYGPDTIRTWLKNGFGIVMNCELDSNGHVSKFSNKIRSKFYYLKNSNVDPPLIDTARLLKTLKYNNVRFSICMDDEILNWLDTADVMAIEFEENPNKRINIGFPGGLSRMFWDTDHSTLMVDSLLNYISRHEKTTQM